jgi:hypothetical protein
MTEGLPRTETLKDSLKTAYALFGNLSQKYGSRSEEGGFTFLKFIPVSDDEFDKVSGRYFGKLSNTVEIFFRKGKDAAQVTLTKDVDGSISLSQASIFVQQMTIKGNILVKIQDANVSPDIAILNELLRKAEKICVNEKDWLQTRLKVANELGKTRALDIKKTREKKKL